MQPRLSSTVQVGALIRLAEVQGGFAAVLRKGDATAGAILVVLAEKGRKLRIVERVLQAEETYGWQDIAVQAAADEGELDRLLERRLKFDPDLWLLELDVPSVERFAAEMNPSN